MTLFEALTRLGDTKESVSAQLKELGIKGEVNSYSKCPIAKYVRLVTGYNNVHIALHATIRDSFDVNIILEKVRLPDNIEEWIKDFDRNNNPEFNQ